jgi:hypothetical protein
VVGELESCCAALDRRQAGQATARCSPTFKVVVSHESLVPVVRTLRGLGLRASLDLRLFWGLPAVSSTTDRQVSCRTAPRDTTAVRFHLGPVRGPHRVKDATQGMSWKQFDSSF